MQVRAAHMAKIRVIRCGKKKTHSPAFDKLETFVFKRTPRLLHALLFRFLLGFAPTDTHSSLKRTAPCSPQSTIPLNVSSLNPSNHTPRGAASGPLAQSGRPDSRGLLSLGVGGRPGPWGGRAVGGRVGARARSRNARRRLCGAG